ncbi:MAG: hypothetical protein R2751_15245 [Bacteroidales bacterium]
MNPGAHSVENYTDDGQLRGFWQNRSPEIDGFLGCCNPAEITSLPDGAFVTSEKGLVRIKIHEASGALRTVVAGPASFQEEGRAPEVCAGDDGRIYALDFDKSVVRVYAPKS